MLYLYGDLWARNIFAFARGKTSLADILTKVEEKVNYVIEENLINC